MKKTHSRFERARGCLLFWCLFVGLGAVAGSVGMLTALDGSNMGMQPLLPYFQVLPFADLLFQDFLFPGLALLAVNGLPNLLAAALLRARRKSGLVLGGVLGVTLMLWITIQFVIFPLNFLSTAYFIFGLAQAATGFAAWVFAQQEAFSADRADYPHIGQDPTRLVVCFSRLGYTRRLALEAADRTGADLYEIRAAERTEGTLGFWWCGRFGMHRRPMAIEPPTVDLTAYEQVTVCTPIWVFAVAAPVRAFCQQARGKIRRADYILCHFQRCAHSGAVAELDGLLGLRGEGAVSVCCRWGREIKRVTLPGKEVTSAK